MRQSFPDSVTKPHAKPQLIKTSFRFSASLLLAAACGEVKSDGDTDAASAVDAAAGLVDATANQPDASIADATVGLVDATIVEPDATVVQPDASFACVPGSIECANATLTECDSTGQVPVETACALGCMGTSRCADLDPSNGLASNLDTAATTFDVVFTGTATIDTSAGTISDSSGALALSTEVITGGPVDLFVIEVKSLTASDINVVGNRALAIVSDGDIVISGVLDVSADKARPGAGALTSSSTCQGGQGGVSGEQASGGGGGGFGQLGGRGGIGGVSGGVTGVTSGNAMLQPLRGGCRGGNGGTNQLNSSPTDSRTDPGAGGGAVQLVSSTRIMLTMEAAITANGGGNKQWTGGATYFCVVGFPCSPSDGAGSGGAILLEAPIVSISGSATLAANGGGGGCGRTNGGEDGTVNATPASGGDCQTIPAFGDGGNGGAGTSANGGNGGNGTGNTANGGGGGGGVGRIRVNLPLGSTFSPAGIVSPAATAGARGTR